MYSPDVGPTHVDHGKFMNLLALVYTFGNPIHDIEKTTWILVVVVEIQ